MEKINKIFETFAGRFIGRIRAKSDIVNPELLTRYKLDFSLESLDIVDEYAERVRSALNQIEHLKVECENTVLWGGAYIGEVIRRNSPRKYDWVDYNKYVPTHPEIVPMLGPRTLATCGLLFDEITDFMNMPVNKMARRIYEGPENNLRFFAESECQP